MIVDTKVLSEALEVTKFGLAKKAFIDGMDGYGFYGGNICTCNDEIALTHWSPINNINANIDAKSLLSILKESCDKYLNMYCVDSTLHINGTSTSARLPLNQASYIRSYMSNPQVPSFDSDKWRSISSDFVQQAKKALSTVSKNMARPILTCLYWNNDVLEASDNIALTHCTLATAHPDAKGILIPAKSASVLVKFDPTAFVLADDWVHFKTRQDAIVSCLTFEGVFPDLSKCLSKECTTSIEFPPSFLAMLKRAGKITPKNDYLEKQARVSISKGTLTVRVQAGKDGEFQESCPVNLHDSLTFLVDPDRLKQFLGESGNYVVGFTTHNEGRSGLLRLESENMVRMLIVSLSTI
jgi:hypothetical protein